MKLFLLTAALSSGMALGGIILAESKAQSFVDSVRLEKLGAYCDAGSQEACRLLVIDTVGRCAGPKDSGCFYDSTRID